MTKAVSYRGVLALVVLGYVGLTLAVGNLGRYLSYDEAIYLSQVYPGPALPFTASRARGMPLLLAPMGLLDAPVPVVRFYLMLVSAVLMYLGFQTWLPVLRGRAVLAAALFGVGWLPLFYDTEAFPNLPVAFGVIAATGYLARYLTGVSGRGALVGCSVAVAAVALFRPTEAVFLTAGLAVAALPRAGLPRAGLPRAGRDLAWRCGLPALGLILGWLPWLIEGQLRFGGPLRRLRLASTNIGAGFHPGNVRQHLGLTDGPGSGGAGRLDAAGLGPGSGSGGGLGWPGPGWSSHETIPALGLLWWALIGVSVLVLVVRVLTGTANRVQRAGAVAASVGLATATQYLFLTRVQEARFLLPAYAALTLALVAALPSLAPRVPDPSPTGARHLAPGLVRPLSALLVTVLAGLGVGFGYWQVTAARRAESHQEVVRAWAERLVRVVRRETRPPCAVAAEVAFPVIAFGTGCRGAPFRPDSPDITVAGLTDRAALPPVYVLTSTDPTRTGVRPVAGSVRSLANEGVPGWWLFVASPAEVATPDVLIAAR